MPRLVTQSRARAVKATAHSLRSLGSNSVDANVVFRNWGRDPPHQVRVIDDEGRLPRDASSWR